MKVIEAKRKGETIVQDDAVDEVEPTTDLLEALRASIEASKGGRRGKAAARAPRRKTKSTRAKSRS
jgi:non-homologous end joining protein Ku